MKRALVAMCCCAAVTVGLIAGIGPASARRSPVRPSAVAEHHQAITRALRELLATKSKLPRRAAPCTLEGGVCVHPCSIPVAGGARQLSPGSCGSVLASQPCRELIAVRTPTAPSGFCSPAAPTLRALDQLPRSRRARPRSR